VSGRVFKMTFVEPDGKEREVDAPDGDTVLDIAHDNDIDLEGACEGSMACSTCHVIVDPQWHGRLPAGGEEEDDILDMAFGLARTSRLGCQITITEKLDGLVVRLPVETRNMLLD
jgi:ferredoxin, 2Fe-2S